MWRKRDDVSIRALERSTAPVNQAANARDLAASCDRTARVTDAGVDATSPRLVPLCF